jgi:hypothetical protein
MGWLTGSTAALATMAVVLAIPQVTFGLIANVFVVAGGIGICAGLAAAWVFRRPSVEPAPSASY